MAGLTHNAVATIAAAAVETLRFIVTLPTRSD
jgi:hypothetical protein